VPFDVNPGIDVNPVGNGVLMQRGRSVNALITMYGDASRVVVVACVKVHLSGMVLGRTPTDYASMFPVPPVPPHEVTTCHRSFASGRSCDRLTR
jgi:hypothetical protein